MNREYAARKIIDEREAQRQQEYPGWPFTWNHSIRVVIKCVDGEERTFRRFFVYDQGKFVGTYCMLEKA